MLQRNAAQLWELAETQHGVVSRAQLLELGLTSDAIMHRIARGRLHPVWRGVYAVGRPQLTTRGRWMAAVLSCGSDAVLSHGSAAALWRLGNEEGERIEVSVPAYLLRRRRGIVVHRRAVLDATELSARESIPVTSPASTLVDIALRLSRGQLETAINEADKRGLVGSDELRSALDLLPRRPGIARVRDVLDRRTFTLTDSDLERRFLRIVRDAGLPRPETQREVDGFRVDFFWPEVGLVVETDGLRYHRAPAQQARDRIRDQAHAAAGLTSLRFTHAQVWYEAGYVRSTLTRVYRRFQNARRARSTATGARGPRRVR
jgi:very-short-patch-repair endonuclease